ncbi:FAD/NAD(P)-binding domain-containing protein [Lentinus tigrinus ALCF2SS1-7]|uniref:FAD/NAD(P)-binding domain-containing protein n=1 Tax=Lentinus tigrinus ALCF2SS1-7 TaxID=1328758 RepID=UPI0011662648|nr:FAD/NAD(P)-binding domain-containing protein [Lentinus tigrinus ALCF2SS1-7]
MDLLPNAALEASWPGHKPQSICVIGAGPAGLSALKIIKDSQKYKDGLWTATAFEARDNVGGVWLPAPGIGDPPLTPLYDSLTTNLPHPVMAYTSFPFPPETALFPPAATVLKYMGDYAAHFDLYPLIQLKTPVLSVTRDNDAGNWVVTVRSPETHSEETSTFDYIVVANGHYRVPRFPSTPGLKEWVEAKKAMHSVYYRNPSDFGNARTVVVVGAGPSGQDLCTDLLASGRVVIHSVSGAVREDLHDGRLKVRGRIAQYGDLSEGRVVFEDGSEESGVDRCVLATGYKMDFPFFPSSILRQSLPPPVPPLPGALYNSTYHVFPLAKHVFPLVNAEEFPSSTVAFLGLPIRVAPLPLLEAQMRAVLHVFAHPESLDPTQEAVDIIARYETLQSRVTEGSPTAAPTITSRTTEAEEVAKDASSASADPVELAIANAWHRFDGHEQFEYRDAMHAFAGASIRVPAWEIEMYDAKGILREEWQDLERLGQADEWVRGVGSSAGEKGTEEWVALMRKLLKRAEERHPERSRL